MLTLATWNVRTLLDNLKADRPGRRTALVARELARYVIDIAALSETRFADKGQLTETGGGYTFFWSGRRSEERRETGVGFAIKSILVRKLASIPEGINDRLMKMQLPLGNKRNATIISAYAPTMTNPDEGKDKFYKELVSPITSAQSEKLILLGDFNTRVGTDHQAWPRVLSKHGIRKCNSNGQLLLQVCASHDLAITNTMFRCQPVTRHRRCTHVPSLASYRLRYRQGKRQAGRETGQVWRRLLDRSPPHHCQNEPPHSTKKKTTGAEIDKETSRYSKTR